MTDFLEDALMHSWGKSPKQKAAEKRYNAEYYRRNKDKWKKYRENAKANMSQLDKNIEGAQTRHDDAARAYGAAKHKLNTLRNQYQKFLEGARQMADNERDKLIKQYEANERTYTRANDVKLAKAKARKVAKEFKSNWKIGAAAISDSVKKGADFVKSLFK